MAKALTPEMPPAAPVYLTIDEVAAVFRVSKRTMQDFAIRHRYLRKLRQRGLVENASIPSMYNVWRNEKRPIIEELEFDYQREISKARAWLNGVEQIDGEGDGWVYFFQCGESVKIGFSRDWKRRHKEIQTSAPAPLKVLRVQKGTQAGEAALHARFSDLHVHLEWYRYEGELKRMLARKVASDG